MNLVDENAPPINYSVKGKEETQTRINRVPLSVQSTNTSLELEQRILNREREILEKERKILELEKAYLSKIKK